MSPSGSTGPIAGDGGNPIGGGLLDKPPGMFGGVGAGASPVGAPTGGGPGSLLGGGVSGGALASGLGDLLNQFSQATNAPVSPDQLSQVLDRRDLDESSRQTGLGRGDLHSQLSSVLLQVVDKLTPHGRLPSADDHAQWA